MAFFRGLVPEVSVWRRFRDASDIYAVMRQDGLVGTRALGNAEAMVELFLELVPEFPPSSQETLLRDAGATLAA